MQSKEFKAQVANQIENVDFDRMLEQSPPDRQGGALEAGDVLIFQTWIMRNMFRS